jgi:hypothetical protein
MVMKHDIPGVVQDFQAKKFPERAALMKHVMSIMETPPVRQLVLEVAVRAGEQNASPVQVLGMGFIYGVVIGILAEKYHRGSRQN